MDYSTLDVSDCQFYDAFQQLFPKPLLLQAVARLHFRTRNRKLPLWVLLILLIRWFWSPDDKLPAVVHWVSGLDPLAPSDPAVYAARARLGWTPVFWLRKQVVKPMANETQDAYAFYQGRRILAIDGTSFTLADTPANDKSFGRPKNQHGTGGYPKTRVIALCEVGTHALIDWVARDFYRSEHVLARRILDRVPANSLLLADRCFHSFELWETAMRCRYDLLIRVQKGPKFPVNQELSDGSYLSHVTPRHGRNRAARVIPIRVIRYQWTDELGKIHRSRLATSLRDEKAHPAEKIIAMYHQRWEQELVFREIKQQLSKRVTQVRAQDPIRVLQEIDCLLMGHYVVRWTMLQAARLAGVEPTRLSFQGAVRVLKTRLSGTKKSKSKSNRSLKSKARKRIRPEWEAILREIGRDRLRKRRNRQYPRVRKTTRSHWKVKKPKHVEGRLPTLVVVPPTDP